MRRFALLRIKKFRLDLIREAIKLLLDNPDISNREIARQINVSEPSIRYWKKQSFWEVERQKLINDHAEMMELNKAQQRREYKENLEKQRQHLEILLDQVFANSMRAIIISNKVYANCCMMDDPLKACAMAIKSGAHTQAKAAMQGVSAYIAISDHLYQFHVLIEYFEGLEEEED
ncbi:MAG: winged helix-turn-helix domain-containing protein [Planktothrix rubescens PR222]